MRYIWISILIVLSSCELITASQEEQQPVARVYDTYLYQEELSAQMPNPIDSLDSVVFAKRLIDLWIEKQLLLYNAENNLSEEAKNVEYQLKEYKTDLLIYAYESQLINQKLDTVISQEELTAYYEENKANFLLTDYIVKVVYVKLDTTAPDIKKVRRWIKNLDEDNFQKLEDYCHQFAANYYLDDNTWLYIDELLREIPIELYSKEQLLRNHKFIDFSDGSFSYLVKIQDYRLKDALSPLSLEKENIRNLILNQRKSALLSELRVHLRDEGLANNDFEVFTE